MKRTPIKRKTQFRAKRATMRFKGGQKRDDPNSVPPPPHNAYPHRLKKSIKLKSLPSLSKLKKKLDSVFSQYIRLKHPARCYTCGKAKHRKHLQCGHFISRSYLATRFDENNCRPQCVGCNMFGNGMPLDFEERLKQELGADFVETMKAKRHQITKLDRGWYTERIAHYQSFVDCA